MTLLTKASKPGKFAHLKLSALLLPLVCFNLLTACGGSSEPTTRDRSLSPPDYSKLKSTDVEASSLARADDTSLARHLKNGMRLKTRPVTSSSSGGSLNGSPAAEVDSAFDGNTNNQEYSDTNTHEQGVDEADYVKYDGRHLFVSTHPQWHWGESTPNASIRILATDPDQAAISEVSSIALDDQHWGAASELYLVSDNNGDTTGLASLRSTWSYHAWAEPSIAQVATDLAMTIAPSHDAIQLTLYDVRQPAEPNRSWNVEIDGYLQESRKIGNILYLVTQYSPFIPGLNFYPQNNRQANENEELIENTDLDELLPRVSINGGTPGPLVAPGDCLIPVDLDENAGYASMTTLVAINLETQEISSSMCLNANVQGIYASQENLYIGGSSWLDWQTNDSVTVIHKFNLQAGEINYRSTGSVPGWLSWGDASFRMSEYEGVFRIVTSSDDENWNPVHQLNLLADSPDNDLMQVVSTLPNQNRPSAIGKPGEDIYSVRFRGDKAYIVTFERIDPLYVVDLSNPQDPFIAGELELPGFSSYLHPVNDNYLLGFGVDATATSQRGVKVSLFDVSNANNPQEVDSLVFGESGSYSEALYDLHAASFLSPTSDELRFTLPMSIYSSGYNWSHSGLQLFELTGLDSNAASLTHVGEIIAEAATQESKWPNAYGNNRSVLHNDTVYFIYSDDIFSSFWQSPEAANGPF